MSFDWNSSLDTDDLTDLLSETSPVGNTQQLPAPPVQSLQSNGPTLGFTSPTDFGFNPLLRDDFQFNYSDGDYYLLNDVESLDPLGGTLGTTPTLNSLPEPTSTIDLRYHTIPSLNQNTFSTSSPTMASTAESNISSAEGSSPFSDSKSPSISDMRSVSNAPDTRVENFLNNLAYLKSPMPSNSTTLDTAAEGTDLVSETLKRQRGTEPDVLTACWTSPLCPSNQKDGIPPDPSNCGGACAPFLFGDQPLPDAIDTSLLSQEIQIQETVESPPRPNLKRSESESSGPSGRKFSTHKSPSTDSNAEIKHEKRSPTDVTIPEANNESKAGKSRTRLPHNQVERKYREGLNTQLESLRRVVPSLQQNRGPLCDGADIEDMSAPTKPSKALVLASATAYIKQMEKEKRQLVDENAALRSRVKALQSLVK
jgi:hypothetical protein